MQCPVDNTTLLLAERQGVEIDYCPQCRGVWLDRGELDKIIERADDDGDDDDDRRRGREPDRRVDHHPPKKKKRWLSEMFELD